MTPDGEDRYESWWDKVPAEDRAFVIVMLGVLGMVVLIMFAAALS